jgi:(acyl-carrier-protein) S-malonyltransferase
MLTSQNELKSYLKNLQFKPNDIKIISNFNADISNDNKKILYALENQMANRVNWVDSILALEKENENKIIEIGPGKILSGLIKRISSKFDIVSINEITDLSKI